MAVFKIVVVIGALLINPFLGLFVAWLLNGCDNKRSAFGNAGDVIGNSLEEITSDVNKKRKEYKKNLEHVSGGEYYGSGGGSFRAVERGAMDSCHWE